MYSLLLASVTAMSAPPSFSSSSITWVKGHIMLRLSCSGCGYLSKYGLVDTEGETERLRVVLQNVLHTVVQLLVLSGRSCDHHVITREVM